MFAILRHYGIPQQIVSAIKLLYDGSTSRVYVEGQLSNPFNVTTGILQGDVLAPFLFIIVVDYVTRHSAQNFGYLTHRSEGTRSRAVPEKRLSDLDYADDIALLENDQVRAQEQLDSYRANARAVGLEINIEKTEQMQLISTAQKAATAPLTIDGQKLAVVEDFKYLGSMIKSSESDIKRRISLAWAAFWTLEKIWKSSSIKTDIKVRIYKASCISILLFGCESWVLNDTLRSKLDVFAHHCYRIMLGIRLRDHITVQEILKCVKQVEVSTQVFSRQLGFIGHCLRLPSDEPANIYALYESQVRRDAKGAVWRKKGAPKKSYIQQVSLHLTGDKKLNLSASEIARQASNRTTWKKMIAAAHYVID
jgi:hypothetical protein